MYRLLFLFFIESRPKELGYAPIGNDVYRLGYSLESLRDLDTAELATEEDRESTYISESLDRLFQMIWEGYPKRGDQDAVQPHLTEAKPEFDTFQIVPLRSHLFDTERLPILNGLLKDDKGNKRWPKVRFRNSVLRQVIEMMSLTKQGKGKRRGRVSYSQLGINQLGLRQVQAVSERIRPLHWDLEFADLLAGGGFDLIVGNPPWLKVDRDETGVIGDVDPKVLIRKVSASKMTKPRMEAFEAHPELRAAYLEEFVEQNSTQAFLNAVANYPLLKGSQTNLFKCFLPHAWLSSRLATCSYSRCVQSIIKRSCGSVPLPSTASPPTTPISGANAGMKPSASNAGPNRIPAYPTPSSPTTPPPGSAIAHCEPITPAARPWWRSMCWWPRPSSSPSKN